MVETYSYAMCAFGSADFMKESERIGAPENLWMNQDGVILG